ncbi:MAG TPA: tetratricopeptide repeat protein [Chloroflexota bacterium]
MISTLATLREGCEPWEVASALNGLGLLAHWAGDRRAARGYLTDALSLFQQCGDTHRAASAMAMLGTLLDADGEPERAAELVAEALRLGPALDELRATVSCIRAAMQISSEHAPAEMLARLLGALDVLFARLSFPLSPRQQASHAKYVAAVRAALGEEAFAAAWADGRALTLEESVTEALAALQR